MSKPVMHGRTRLWVNALAVECPWCFAEPEVSCHDECDRRMGEGVTEGCETLYRRVHGVRFDAARKLALAEHAGKGGKP